MRRCTLHGRSTLGSSCILMMGGSVAIVILVFHIIHSQLILSILLHSHSHGICRNLLPLLVYLTVVLRIILVIIASWLSSHAKACTIPHIDWMIFNTNMPFLNFL